LPRDDRPAFRRDDLRLLSNARKHRFALRPRRRMFSMMAACPTRCNWSKPSKPSALPSSGSPAGHREVIDVDQLGCQGCRRRWRGPSVAFNVFEDQMAAMLSAKGCPECAMARIYPRCVTPVRPGAKTLRPYSWAFLPAPKVREHACEYLLRRGFP
jgi:hypothetical protein